MAAFSMDPTQIEEDKDFTPNATANNAVIGDRFPQAFWIGGASPSDVTIVKLDGTTSLYPLAVPGTWHPCPPFKQVPDAGTTVTSIKVGVLFRR